MDEAAGGQPAAVGIVRAERCRPAAGRRPSPLGAGDSCGTRPPARPRRHPRCILAGKTARIYGDSKTVYRFRVDTRVQIPPSPFVLVGITRRLLSRAFCESDRAAPGDPTFEPRSTGVPGRRSSAGAHGDRLCRARDELDPASGRTGRGSSVRRVVALPPRPRGVRERPSRAGSRRVEGPGSGLRSHQRSAGDEAEAVMLNGAGPSSSIASDRAATSRSRSQSGGCDSPTSAPTGSLASR